MVYRVPTPDCIPHYDLAYGEEWTPPDDLKLSKREKSKVAAQDGAVRVIRRTILKPVRVGGGVSLLKK